MATILRSDINSIGLGWRMEETVEDIVIVGSGGMAREVGWLLRDINSARLRWNLLGYIAPDSAQVGQSCGESIIIGDDRWLLEMDSSLSVAIGIGNPITIDQVRRRLLQNKHLCFPNLVHPSVVWDSKRITLGTGNIICAGTVLTTDITVGSFNILNFGSTYGHDVIVGDCCVINPGANVSGNVKVGNRSLLGAGSVVLENLMLGDDVRVGGGAVVTRDVAPGLTVVGVPARPIVGGKG